MALKLEITSAQARSLGAEGVAFFRLRGGTIGRARDNDWILPDADRVVSSHHARILYDQGNYYIQDSSANGTYLNHEEDPLPSGQPVALSHGDVLYIGDYQIQVELVDDARPGSFPDERPRVHAEETGSFIPSPYVPRRTDWDEGPLGAEGGNSFPATPDRGQGARASDRHLPTPAGEESPAADHVPADRQHFRPPEASPELIPEDLPPPIETILPADWDVAEEQNPEEAPSPPRPAPPPEPPRATSGGRISSPPSPRQTPGGGSPAAPDLDATEVVPPPESAPRPAPPPQAMETPAVAAFFEGLELPSPALESTQSEALMRQAGRLLRTLTIGTMEVLQARTKVKSEFRLAQTIVRESRNNPLKFSLNADQALTQLFVAQQAGFMDADAAFAEALRDIKQHEMAMIAGMRAAFDCLLARFSPEKVEAAMRASGKRGSVLPFAAKSWEFYQRYYAEFKANASDDFQGIFGEDFVRAYERQIALLDSRDGRP
jgi:type VI secretion system protein